MECDGCTLCCKIINVPWMDSPAGEYCKKCNEGWGCKIFHTVDDRCKQFSCMYNQMERATINLRPDKCKVMFEKITDDIIHGSLHPDYSLNYFVKQQINMFLQEGFSIIMESLQFKNPHIYPTKNVQSKDVYKKFMDKVKENNGNRNL